MFVISSGVMAPIQENTEEEETLRLVKTITHFHLPMHRFIHMYTHTCYSYTRWKLGMIFS